MKLQNAPIKKMPAIALLLIGCSILYFSSANKVRVQNFALTTLNGAKNVALPQVRIELKNAVNKYAFFTDATGSYNSWVSAGKYQIKISKTGYLTTLDSVVFDYNIKLRISLFAAKKAIIKTVIKTIIVREDSEPNHKIITDSTKDSLRKIKACTISPDGINSTTFDAKELKKLGGTRDVTTFAAKTTGFGSGVGTIGGARSAGDAIYIDGIRTGSPSVDRRKMVVGESAAYKKTATMSRGVDSKTEDIPAITDDINIRAGLLTAGEVNDFSKWNMWNDIAEGDLKTFTSTWNLQPKNRYTVQVSNKDNFPIPNATVILKDKKGNTIWTALSDQTGKAELWADIYITSQTSQTVYDAFIIIQDNITKIKNIKPFKQGINFIKVNAECSHANTVDIAWVVDATGSMGDEIAYLKAELSDVMQKTKAKHPDLNFRLGSVFYRDYADAYLTQTSELSSDVTQTVNFIKDQSAGGGGDFPEAVDTALSMAINKLNWSKNARTKLLFLVLDAPPHANLADIERVKRAIEMAAKLGIHIIPVASSGVDKSTEYLMRCFALTTNGTYVFLTDDSGIGGAHIKPTTDEYKVETLNGLLLRLIDQYTLMVSCTKQLPDTFKQYIKDTIQVQNRFNPIDTTKKDSVAHTQNPKPNDSVNNQPQLKFTNWKYYPNPTTGPLTVEIEGQINELFLTDFGGKILMRFQPGNERMFNINLQDYPSGVYLFRYYYNDKMLDGKVVLMH